MYSDDITQKVAEAARKILTGQTVTEKLHPNQQKIDVVDDEKIDAKDFAKLRAMKNKVKEEVEQIDELTGKGKLPQIADYHQQKSGEAKDKMEKIRSSNRKVPVPTELTSKISAKDTEAKYHSHQEKRAKSLMAKGVMSNLLNKVKKEEVEQVEQIEEGIEDRIEAARAKAKAAGKTIKDKAPAPKSNVRKVEGSAYGGAKQKDEPEEDDDDTPAKKTVKYGARQNFVRSKRVNESFTEMLSAYKEEGLKFVADTLVVEEPTEEEFNAEIKKAQDKSQGKDKAEVAKASVQAVKNEEVEVIDADQINGVEEVTIDERHMTDSEMNNREKIVKSMKKGLSGFKQRYGDKAKNVMYATATKQAMKD